MTPAEKAARTYIAMWNEPDADRRRALMEQCWAERGRLVTRISVLDGREALWKSMGGFHTDPRGLRAKLTTVIDAGETVFRFAGIVAAPDGASLGEAYDVGEIGADGKIVVLYTFSGPLASAG